MKKVSFAVILIVLMNMLGAQTNFDKNIIRHGVYLSQTDGHLNYSIDRKKLISTYDLSKNALNASAKSDNVNILMEYVNPLKMKYNVTYTNRINPDLENSVKFFNALTPMLQSLGFNAFEKTNFSMEGFYTDIKGSMAKEAEINNLEKVAIGFKTIELYQLGLLIMDHSRFYIDKTGNGKKAKQDFEKKLQAFLKKIMDNEIDLENSKANIRKSLNYLLNADEFTKTKEAYLKHIQSLDSLKMDLKRETTKLENVNKIYGTFVLDKIPQDSLQEIIVNTYQGFLLEQYREKVKAEFDRIQKVIDNIASLGQVFKKNLDLYDQCSCESSFKIGEIPIANEDIKEVIVTITNYDVELTQDFELKVSQRDEIKGQINLKAFSLLSVDFAFGFLYPFNLSYPVYSSGTDSTGQLVVAQAKDEKIRFSAGAMLNLIFKTPTYPAFPLIQLGIGTGNDAPTIFLGVGLKFIKNFTISGGIISGWYKELNNLKVGQSITGDDDLRRDLEYVPLRKPAFYIGVQYSF